MKFIITAGTVNDSTKAIELLKNIIRKGIGTYSPEGSGRGREAAR